MSRNTVNDYTRTRDGFHNNVNKADVTARVYLAKLGKETRYCEIRIKFRCITILKGWDFTILVIVGKLLLTSRLQNPRGL